MTEHLVIAALLSFLVVIALAIIVLRDLLAGVILLGLYSLVAAGAFVVMDAVDVAFTEAAVGAGISTILFLGTLSFTRHEQKRRGHDSLPAGVFVVITGALLIYGTLDMPHYGSATSPAQTHPELAVRFLERSDAEVGPPNIVTSVLASYRGYDTLGETVVVFAAGIAVLSLLGLKRRGGGAAPGRMPGGRGGTRSPDEGPDDGRPDAGRPDAGRPDAGRPDDAGQPGRREPGRREPGRRVHRRRERRPRRTSRSRNAMKIYARQRHRVLQVVTRLIVPFVLLFALYVQFHGDYGPGGGFQAGVIFASAFILHGLIFGLQRTRRVITPGMVRVLMAGGVLLYGGTGVVTMLLGGNLLDYDYLAHDPLHGQHWGIFAVELGVGITVTGVMIGLFYGFASRRSDDPEPGGVSTSGEVAGAAPALLRDNAGPGAGDGEAALPGADGGGDGVVPSGRPSGSADGSAGGSAGDAAGGSAGAGRAADDAGTPGATR